MGLAAPSGDDSGALAASGLAADPASGRGVRNGLWPGLNGVWKAPPFFLSPDAFFLSEEPTPTAPPVESGGVAAVAGSSGENVARPPECCVPVDTVAGDLERGVQSSGLGWDVSSNERSDRKKGGGCGGWGHLRPRGVLRPAALYGDATVAPPPPRAEGPLRGAEWGDGDGVGIPLRVLACGKGLSSDIAFCTIPMPLAIDFSEIATFWPLPVWKPTNAGIPPGESVLPVSMAAADGVVVVAAAAPPCCLVRGSNGLLSDIAFCTIPRPFAIDFSEIATFWPLPVWKPTNAGILPGESVLPVSMAAADGAVVVAPPRCFFRGSNGLSSDIAFCTIPLPFAIDFSEIATFLPLPVWKPANAGGRCSLVSSVTVDAAAETVVLDLVTMVSGVVASTDCTNPLPFAADAFEIMAFLPLPVWNPGNTGGSTGVPGVPSTDDVACSSGLTSACAAQTS